MGEGFLMSTERNIKVGTVLSFVGGVLTLLHHNHYSWNFASFPISLIIIGGVLVLVSATFMYIDSQHSRFWRAVILFSSTLDLLAIGLAGSETLRLQGVITLVLGTIGGALGIAQK